MIIHCWFFDKCFNANTSLLYIIKNWTSNSPIDMQQKKRIQIRIIIVILTLYFPGHKDKIPFCTLELLKTKTTLAFCKSY